MSIPPLSAAAVEAADALARARRQLAEVSDRLVAVTRAATELAADTDWQTPSARRFHRAVDRWRDEGSGAAAVADDIDGDLWWVQIRVLAQVRS